MKQEAEAAFKSLSSLNDPRHAYARMPFEVSFR
jgi:hypothetical protein